VVSERRTDDPKGRKVVSLLGATGSIGANTVDILRRHRDRFAVAAVTANRDADALAAVARELDAKVAVIAEPKAYAALKAALADTGIAVGAGADALVEAAGRPADLTVAAIVGAAGLAPTLAAIESGSDIALANKECLVCAGDLFINAVRRHGVQLLPVDSEHNAIFQALASRDASAAEQITLTASGGPFRDWPLAALAEATPDQAAAHPNWSMGRKVSVDSSTLMNKGLEVIEAHYLFAMAPSQIDVLIHPQSIVHGLVAYRDGSVIAHLAVPDMRIPLGYCLWWPDRAPDTVGRLDLTALRSLTFEEPDRSRFPGLALARRALDAGTWATNILNAANEIAVEAFLAGRIGYLDIVSIADEVLAEAAAINLPQRPADLEGALAVDAEGRRLARVRVDRIARNHQRAELT
jgi:1-deoxy-D-xylulose-5-phosphate reductoisomerase